MPRTDVIVCVYVNDFVNMCINVYANALVYMYVFKNHLCTHLLN